MPKKERLYPAQLTWADKVERAARVRAWADVRESELAPLMRQIVAAGLAALEPVWEAEAGGALDPAFLAGHVADCPVLP
jgi:hypothetical protein